MDLDLDMAQAQVETKESKLPSYNIRGTDSKQMDICEGWQMQKNYL